MIYFIKEEPPQFLIIDATNIIVTRFCVNVSWSLYENQICFSNFTKSKSLNVEFTGWI